MYVQQIFYTQPTHLYMQIYIHTFIHELSINYIQYSQDYRSDELTLYSFLPFDPHTFLDSFVYPSFHISVLVLFFFIHMIAYSCSVITTSKLYKLFSSCLKRFPCLFSICIYAVQLARYLYCLFTPRFITQCSGTKTVHIAMQLDDQIRNYNTELYYGIICSKRIEMLLIPTFYVKKLLRVPPNTNG